MAEVGTISAIISIATFGAQTSMVLYDLASTIGSAKRDVTVVARNIASFCSVLQHLGTTLEKARSSRFSISAISTTQDILDRCQELFQDIADIANTLLKPENVNGSAQSSMSHIARVKWVFKRVKIQKLQAELDSMKLTLHLMLTTLDFAQRISTRRDSGVDYNAQTNLEDSEAHAIAASLIVAQQAADEDVETLEAAASDDEEAYESSTDILATKKQRTRSYRASVLIFGEVSVQEVRSPGRPLTWTGSHSNMDTRQLFVNLLKRWANCETALERFQGTTSSSQKPVQAAPPKLSATAPRAQVPRRRKVSVAEVIDQSKAEAFSDGTGDDKLITVDLSHRNLVTIPNELMAVAHNVERLALSYNCLTEFNAWVDMFHNLRYLNIRSNQLKKFPNAIIRITSLEILDASNNEINALPEAMIHLNNLKVLAMKDNHLFDPPTVLCVLQKLAVIRIEGNPFLKAPKYEALVVPKDLNDTSEISEYTSGLKNLLLADRATGFTGMSSPFGFVSNANSERELAQRMRDTFTNGFIVPDIQLRPDTKDIGAMRRFLANSGG